jgi:hypothetical protein
MKSQLQSVWYRLPKAVKVLLGIIAGGGLIALMIQSGGAGLSCH